MSAYSERTRRMPNVPLTYISVCKRMRAYAHTLAYADAIRCSVTAHLQQIMTTHLNVIKPAIHLYKC